ncbi:MAG: hypothetical protein ACOX6D_10035 [Thermoguttaceae bacterium]
MTNETKTAATACRVFGINRFFRFIFCVAFLILLLAEVGSLPAASQCRTRNFVVTAANADLANRVAQCAEECRSRLAKLWLGTEIQPWATPCPIRVKSGPDLGAGGETTFTFVGNTVTGWKMSVQGTEERILDSVVPHEVSHTIFATYFCRPVPRWIDEGAATSVEADVERSNYRSMLIGFLQERRGLPFNTMVSLSEYPSDMMPFYSQGFSVCEYLIAVGGHRRLIEFARDAMQHGNWSESVQKYYGYKDLGDLQIRWTDWISAWHNAGHPAQLPAVAKLVDYPYDIFGRTIDGNTVPPTPAVAMNIPSDVSGAGNTPVNPLNSFVAMPRSGYNIEAEDFHVAFDAGVGSALPSGFSPEGAQVAVVDSTRAGRSADEANRGPIVYQGTYGHRASSPTTPQNTAGVTVAAVGSPIPSAMLAPPMGDLSHGYQPSPLPSPAVDVPIRIGDAPTVLGQSPF